MDKYKKGLLASLSIAISCLFISIFIFTIDTEQESTVLGIQDNSNITQTRVLEDFVFKNRIIKYDGDIFQIKEDGNSSLILPKKWKTFQYAVVSEFEDIETLENNLRNESGYSGLQPVSIQDYDTYTVNLYTFEQPFFLKEGTETKFLTLYTTEDENSGEKFYIEVRNFNYRDDSTTDSAFVEIVKSLSGLQISDDVLGVDNEQINLGKILGQSATLKVFARNCYELKFSNELEGFAIAGRSFDICSAGTGSGFLINNSSEIMTNAHVVSPDGFDSIVNGVSTDGQYEEALAQDLIDILYLFVGDFAYLLSQEQLETFYLTVLDEMYKENLAQFTLNESEIYVGFDNNFEINIDKQDLENKTLHQTATLVKANDIPSFYQTLLLSLDEDDLYEESLGEMSGTEAVREGITGVADLALIKMDGVKNRPSVQVREENPISGEQIHVVGYPAINEDEMMISATELLDSTITSGSITGIKPNTTNSYNLLQIDASIESGNSGGPILDSEGKVLGMTTYSFASDSGNFNWGISGEEIKNFISQSGSSSEENEHALLLSSAVTDISKDYYSRSKGKLEDLVANESSLSSILSPIIKVCDTNIEQGNDKSPWIDLGFIDIPNWGLLLIGGVILVIIGILIILIAVVAKSKREKRSEEIEEVFTNPQQPSEQVQPNQPDPEQYDEETLVPKQPQTPQQPPQVQEDEGYLVPRQPLQAPQQQTEAQQPQQAPQQQTQPQQPQQVPQQQTPVQNTPQPNVQPQPNTQPIETQNSSNINPAPPQNNTQPVNNEPQTVTNPTNL